MSWITKQQLNPYNIQTSPALVKISEEVINILPDGRVISETSFKFQCNGVWYHIEPGKNN